MYGTYVPMAVNTRSGCRSNLCAVRVAGSTHTTAYTNGQTRASERIPERFLVYATFTSAIAVITLLPGVSARRFAGAKKLKGNGVKLPLSSVSFGRVCVFFTYTIAIPPIHAAKRCASDINASFPAFPPPSLPIYFMRERERETYVY